MLSPYTPNKAKPWNEQRIVHLFRRAAFGATWADVEWSQRVGFEKTIEALLAGDLPIPHVDFHANSSRLAEIAISLNLASRLKVAWLYRILHSADPLGEQLTLMWHNHFATSHVKVEDANAMWLQNETLRRHARGRFGDLLHHVLRDPAMLIWLDADQNRKDSPNENLARELLELFTLGIGNYTERDIKEIARALTGRTTANYKCVDDSEQHDSGAKTILGKTRAFKPDDLAPLLAGKEATALRIAWRICGHFAGEQVATDTEKQVLADELRKNEMNIGATLEMLLRSDWFYSQRCMSKRITPPVAFVASVLHATDGNRESPKIPILVDWLDDMGQDLFAPPNVGGWKGGESWLSPQRWIARLRFAEVMADQPTINEANHSLSSLLFSHQIKPTATNDIRLLLSKPEAHVD